MSLISKLLPAANVIVDLALGRVLKMTVNILVIGGGASGAFYASRFHQSDNVQVSIICRSNYQVVLKHGFKIISKKLYGNKRAYIYTLHIYINLLVYKYNPFHQ